MLRECVHCEVEFDLSCSAKKRVGGKINECPDCVEELKTEHSVRYLGLPAGDGKANALSTKSQSLRLQEKMFKVVSTTIGQKVMTSKSLRPQVQIVMVKIENPFINIMTVKS